MDQTIAFRAQSADDENHGRDAQSQRLDSRTNIFVIAALYSDHGSGPIRIRNLSCCGALVEAAVIPPEGSRLRMSRGGLSVTGEIVWRREGKAGIRFDVPVTVGDWLPAGLGATVQQSIDEIVHNHKTGFAPAPVSPAAPPSTNSGSKALAAELGSVAAAIKVAAGDLASDVTTIAGHPRALQILDVTARQLEKLVNQLAPPPAAPGSH
jgi:hypothetical protein